MGDLNTFYTDATGAIQNVEDEAISRSVLKGKAKEYETLTAIITNATDLDNNINRFEYQWQKEVNGDWVDLQYGENEFFELTDDEVGYIIRVRKSHLLIILVPMEEQQQNIHILHLK